MSLADGCSIDLTTSFKKINCSGNCLHSGGRTLTIYSAPKQHIRRHRNEYGFLFYCCLPYIWLRQIRPPSAINFSLFTFAMFLVRFFFCRQIMLLLDLLHFIRPAAELATVLALSDAKSPFKLRLMCWPNRSNEIITNVTRCATCATIPNPNHNQSKFSIQKQLLA